MKKVYLSILLCCFTWLDSIAKLVPVTNAQQVASNFLSGISPASRTPKGGSEVTLVHQEVKKQTAKNARQVPFTYFYVFAAKETGGVVFISADDNVSPVLGYIRNKKFDATKMPANLTKWLEGYKHEIRLAAQQTTSDEKIKQAWKALQTPGQPLSKPAFTLSDEVEPLLTTTWDQSPYYNELCPYDSEEGERAVTGCVATAMAQIMKYWKYPAKGSGFHSYNHEKYGTLSANFSNTTYDWNNMPDNLTRPNTAVATLMKHVGVSVEMSYGVAADGGSSAYVISAASQTQHCSEYALKTYFGYKDVKGVQRSNYTLTNWINLLKTELDNKQPVLYAGFGGGGGHAFVCDGYDQNNMFHMNWGWGGAYDGYFVISALNPDGQGTGGGTGSYNSNQQALINIKAPTVPDQQTADLQLYDDVTINTPTISFGTGFTVHTDIINNGTGTFKGDYGAAAFDENGNLVEFIKTYTKNELEAGYHYTEGIDFETDGMLSLLPGTYTIYIFHKPENGQWVQLKGSSFSDHVILKVINKNNLDLYTAVSVQKPNEVYQGKKIVINTAVQNLGTGSFTGTLEANVYDLKGDLVFSIASKQVTALCKNCKTGDITFQNDKLDVEPGTYLLAVLHHTEADGWRITGSEKFTNPIKVVVKEAPIAGDEYENNNTVATAYNLTLNFVGKTARVTTPRSSIHVGTDYDYYKITLPSGRKYELTARVNDSYDSNDNTTYNNDVLFTLSEDGETWTEAYDQELPSAVEIEGGKTIYAFVSPYFQGETGTYALDITVKELQPTGIPDDVKELAVQAYPNPTTGMLQIQEKKEYTEYVLTSLTGKILMNIPKGSSRLDISHLPAGMYLLRIGTKAGYQVQKIIKR